MKKYEFCHASASMGCAAFLEKINKLGSEGWSFVTVFHFTVGIDTFLFQRELE